MQAMGTGFICYIISKMIFSQKHMLSLQHIQSEEHKQKSISQERPLDTSTSTAQEKVKTIIRILTIHYKDGLKI